MPLLSWRLVGRRSLADRLVIAVAWLVMVAAVTLLAAGAMYADAVARSGLLRSLTEADPLAANVQVSALVPVADAAAADATVTDHVTDAVGSALGELVRFGRSESYALPDQPDEVRDLVVFGFAENIEAHARLVGGAWPVAGGEPLEAAVAQPVAERLGLDVGAELELASRLEDDRLVSVRVAGIFSVDDPSDPYWWREPLDLTGISEGSTFTTHGPLFVARDDFLAHTIVHRAELRWRVFPELDAVAAGNMDGLRSGIGSLAGRLDADLDEATSIRVDSGLPEVLASAGASLLVSRAGVLLLNVQLAVLAGYALLLVGALIVEQRRAEIALLRSRGASAVQLFRFGLMEAGLLVVPAALAAPLLAMAGLEIFEHVGPLRGTGLALHPQITQDAVLLGGIACIISLLALALPGLAAMGPLSGVRRAVGRQSQRTLPQRLGLDVALVAMAFIGLWQLQQYGAPLTRGMRGSLGVDPLLIAAPTIGLLAGAVLALRILPLLARGLEDLLARRHGIGTALGSRQLARRPLRYTRAALLLMVASSIGVFAATYGTTWAQSQRDQVDYATGADVRTTARTVTAPAWALDDAYGRLETVSSVVPVVREAFQLGQAGGRGTLLALLPEDAGRIVRFRADLADVPLDGLLATLSAGRPAVSAVELPDGVSRLDFGMDVRLAPQDADGQPVALPTTWAGVGIAALLRDVNGLVHRFPADERVGPGHTEATVPIATDSGDGEPVSPTGDMELVAIEVGVMPMASAEMTGEVLITSLEATHANGAAARTAVDLAPLRADWQAVQVDPDGIASPDPAPAQRPAGVGFDDGSPLIGSSEVRLSLRPADVPGTNRAPIPALVNEPFLDATGTAVGDQIGVGEQFSTLRQVVVAGVIRGFPTLDPGQPLAVVDLPSTALADYADRSRLLEPLEWWLSAPQADREALETVLRGQPFSVTEAYVGSADLAARLSDPIALGVVGALALGSAAAWFFAALGFIVSAAVATRERLTEFALLRALGLSRRQLALSLSLENVFLLLVSLGVGVGLGALLAWVVLPSVTLTPQGTPPLPHVRVALPWDVLALLLLFGSGLLVVTLVILRRLAAGSGVGSLLRLREE